MNNQSVLPPWPQLPADAGNKLQALQESVAALIKTFESETGLLVNRVECLRYETHTITPPYITTYGVQLEAVQIAPSSDLQVRFRERILRLDQSIVGASSFVFPEE